MTATVEKLLVGVSLLFVLAMVFDVLAYWVK